MKPEPNEHELLMEELEELTQQEDLLLNQDFRLNGRNLQELRAFLSRRNYLMLGETVLWTLVFLGNIAVFLLTRLEVLPISVQATQGLLMGGSLLLVGRALYDLKGNLRFQSRLEKLSRRLQRRKKRRLPQVKPLS